jgi:23S rRNA (cytidine1920-2'-O)/16S rRNA (cytidine1409-2'-O)-methyltransferase
MRRVAEAGAELGLGLAGVAPSRLPGPAGNVEFFLHLRERPPWQELEGAVGVAVADVPVQ